MTLKQVLSKSRPISDNGKFVCIRSFRGNECQNTEDTSAMLPPRIVTYERFSSRFQMGENKGNDENIINDHTLLALSSVVFNLFCATYLMQCYNGSSYSSATVAQW
jgi:hypothetical protein